VANEKDEKIRLLEELVSVLKSQLADRESTIREQNILVAELRSTVANLQGIVANLNETIDEFHRKFFGKSSEKTSTAGDDEEEETGECITVRSHSRKPRSPKSKREDLYGNLPINEVKCDIPEDQRICPDCDAVMEHLGYKFVREELVIIPAKVFRVRYMQETLFCPVCRSEDDTTIKAAVVPKGLLPHSPVSASILAELIYQKSVLHVPFYRQEPIWKEKGCPIPRGTMASWYNECTSRYITPIYDLLHQHLKERGVLHVDETTCQVLHEEGRKATSKSYMWIYTSGTDGLPPIAMYDYRQGRGHEHPENFLEGFKGIIQCDGYSAYGCIEDVMLACCLAHCRRKFFEAVPAARRKKLRLLDINSDLAIPEPDMEVLKDPEVLPAEKGVVYCNRFFFLERQYKEMTPEERKARRLETETPIWEAFWKWLDTINPAGGSKLETAVNYAENHHDSLMNYLKDGRCEISNNAAERRAKTYATARKNFLFHDTVEGAQASAMMLSIIETAKLNSLNVYQYLYMLFLYMPDYKEEPAGIEQLLPWSDFIKQHCSGLTDTETITSTNKPALEIKK
jgi:transposase/uncharacterized coiled-coil protein SlyX